MRSGFLAGFLSCLLLIAAVGVFAKTIASDIWVVSTVASWHEKGKDYNEQNFGMGIEYGLNESSRLSLGQYRNSYYKNSIYAAIQTRWLCTTLVAQVCAATAAGFVSGYTGQYEEVYQPAVIPFITVEGRHLGANIMVVPGFGGSGWIFGLQLKSRW